MRLFEGRTKFVFAAILVALAAAALGVARSVRIDAPPKALARDEPVPEGVVATAPPLELPTPQRVEAEPAAARLPGAVRARPEPDPPRALRGVCGTVRATSGEALAGVRVEARLERGVRVQRLGDVRTDGRGWYAIELDLAGTAAAFERGIGVLDEQGRALLERAAKGEAPASELERLRDAIERSNGPRIEPLVLAVDAGLPGSGIRSVRRELAPPVPSTMLVNLSLSTGSLVEGNVYHRGELVVGATVQLFDADWQLVRSARSDVEGRYRLGVPDPGRFHIHARSFGLGASGNEGFSLGGALPFPEIDLDVDGIATLSGRVLLPDGQPIQRLRIEALQYGLWQGEVFNGRNADVSLIAQAESAGGLCASEAATDENGEFRMEAMQRGDYALRIPALRDETLQPEGVFATGADPHPIVLDVHLLVVEVRAPGYRRSRKETRELEILCTADPPLVKGAYEAGQLSYAPSTDVGATFVVEPGARYVVLARTRDSTARAEVLVPAQPRVQRVALELEEFDPKVAARLEAWSEEAPGMLELAITDPEGNPVNGLRARLVRTEDGREFTLDVPPVSDPRPFDLPPAIYELELEPTGAAATSLIPLRVGAVRVEANDTARVEKRLASGGSFVLRVPASRDPEFSERWAEARFQHGGDRALREAFGVEARLYRRKEEREPGAWKPVEFELESRDAKRRAELRLLPGEDGRAAAIEVGDYLLEVRSPQSVPEWIELEIEAGEQKVVVPELAPQRGR